MSRTTLINKIYFHSCTITGVMDELTNDFRTDDAICVSTQKSDSLFGRHIVLEISSELAEEENYSEVDLDAGKSFGYDEARISFESEEDFFSSVKSIIISDEINEIIELLEEEETTEEAIELLQNICPEWDVDFDTAMRVYDFFAYNEHKFPGRVVSAEDSNYSVKFLNFDMEEL